MTGLMRGIVGRVTRSSSRSCLEKSLALDAPELWNEAGTIAMERGRYDEAVIYFDKAVSRDGATPLYRANRDKAAASAAFVKSASPGGAAPGGSQ